MFDDVTAYGEPQAGPSGIAGIPLGHHVESVKDLQLVLRIDAGSVVGNLYGDAIAADLQGHFAPSADRRAEFFDIGKWVDKDLHQLIPVAINSGRKIG